MLIFVKNSSMRFLFPALVIVIIVTIIGCRPEDLQTPRGTTPIGSSSGIVQKPEDCWGMLFMDDKLYVSSAEGLFWTSDLGQNWKKVSGGGLPTGGTTYVQAQRGVFFVGMESGGLYISLDSGQTWQQSLDVSYKTNIGYAPSLLLFKGDTVFLSARTKDNLTNMIMRSSERGAPNSWVQYAAEIGTVVFHGFINIGNTIYAFSQDGQIFSSTTESGYNDWKYLNNIPGIRENYFPLLWGNVVVMPTGQGVYFSSDNCQSWKAENIGLPGKAYCVSVVANKSTLFVSTGTADGAFTGIYWRKNNSTEWKVVNANIPIGSRTGDNAHYVLTMLATDTHLFIGTHGFGVKILELSKILP